MAYKAFEVEAKTPTETMGFSRQGREYEGGWVNAELRVRLGICSVYYFCELLSH